MLCLFLLVHACSVFKLCLTLHDPMHYSLPGSFCPWNFPGKNTRTGCHIFLQGIFPTQESNPCFLLGLQILYH